MYIPGISYDIDAWKCSCSELNQYKEKTYTESPTGKQLLDAISNPYSRKTQDKLDEIIKKIDPKKIRATHYDALLETRFFTKERIVNLVRKGWGEKFLNAIDDTDEKLLRLMNGSYKTTNSAEELYVEISNMPAESLRDTHYRVLIKSALFKESILEKLLEKGCCFTEEKIKALFLETIQLVHIALKKLICRYKILPFLQSTEVRAVACILRTRPHLLKILSAYSEHLETKEQVRLFHVIIQKRMLIYNQSDEQRFREYLETPKYGLTQSIFPEGVSCALRGTCVLQLLL